METETVTVQVTTRMSNLPTTLGFTSAVSIDLHEVIEELIEDQSGTTHVGSYIAPPPPRILLKPRSFTQHNLSRLLRHELLFADLWLKKSRCADFHVLINNSRERPFLMSVNVKVVKEVRFILPSVSVPLEGASGVVFQRLLEEQTVESLDLDETCSICIENFSESSSKSHHNIIQMPKCLHLFHQGCIFEWLARHNSCPLCRRVPYDEDQETETPRLA